ncbi:hypothetical protein AB0D12_04725 [Streptomyces sp. NPDC048479]|uniref:hypothetical protein n=1 Tax=Streptomyces sp. NPDC048479 TaxID=3154725 RepID=UPI0034266E44
MSSYSIAQAVVPVEHRTEGMTWLTTAASAGTAPGAPLAAHLADAYGSAAGFLFAFAAGLIALAVTGLGRRARWPCETAGAKRAPSTGLSVLGARAVKLLPPDGARLARQDIRAAGRRLWVGLGPQRR